jgi:NDP-sugar pyrophosphorylase family protein
MIRESIIEDGTEIKHTALTNSLVGRNCYVEGQPNREESISLNIGDNCSIVSK